MAMIAIPATTQLRVSPIDPLGPPPRSPNVGSSGAIVRPLASWNAAPRQMSRPPRVTTKEGTPMKAITNPCRPPISAPRRRPTTTTMIQVYGWFAPRPMVGKPFRLEQPHGHGREAHDRPDRQVDVPRHDDQDHAGGHDRDGRGLDGQVPQVARSQEQTVGEEVEGHPQDDQGGDHAQKSVVHLQAREGRLHGSPGPASPPAGERRLHRAGLGRHDASIVRGLIERAPRP